MAQSFDREYMVHWTKIQPCEMKFFNFLWLLYQTLALTSKSEQPLNEVRVPQALPEYYVKYSQFENAKSDYLNRLSSKLSFEPPKPKGRSFYKIKEAF